MSTHEPVLPITTQPMNLFPTMNNCDEVIHLAKSRLPLKSINEVYSLLMIYHNTLLNQLKLEEEQLCKLP